MNRINRSIVRYFILTKRMLRRPGFVAIMVLIPLMVLAITVAAGGKDGGIVNIALAMQDEDDILACQIVDTLINDSGLIGFERCETPADAAAMVKNGKADAAWIFEQDLETKIAKFSNHAHKNNAFVTVVQREDNVFLRFSHEKLNTVLYPYISKAVYQGFLANNIINISELSKQEQESFYNAVNAEGEDLFEFTYAGRDGKLDHSADKETESFLVSPLRGLLAILVVVAGIAASMFHIQDDDNGAFAALSPNAGFCFSILYYSAAVIMAGLIAFAALLLTGMTAGVVFELAALLIYCVCVTGFCLCLRYVLPDTRALGFAAPLLVIVTAVLCPVFFAVPRLPVLQYLLPTYYDIRALTNTSFLWYMVLYSIALYITASVLHNLHRKKLNAQNQ